MSEVFDRLEQLRLKAGLTKREWSALLGKSEQTYSDLKERVKNVHSCWHSFLTLAEALPIKRVVKILRDRQEG